MIQYDYSRERFINIILEENLIRCAMILPFLMTSISSFDLTILNFIVGTPISVKFAFGNAILNLSKFCKLQWSYSKATFLFEPTNC